MFKNYLKIAIRNVQKHKGYAFINIAGLAIGMACCILIIIYILTELSYDKYHNNANRIYRLGLDANVGGNAIYIPISNNPTAPILINDYPEVLNAVRIRPTSKRLVKHEDNQFYEEEIMYADNSIFDIFTFPTIKGDPKSALSRPYTTVISEDTAEKYFGTEDPIGKVLQIDSQENFTVTGVVENVPRNSHFNFDMLFSYETLYSENRQIMEVWLNFNSYTYLLLPENYDYKELEQKFYTLIDQYMGETLKVIGGEMKFFLQPMTSIHLYSHLENEISGNGNILYVYIFSVIALFILCIACINFMNLATARSAIRAKEVGMRKVIGANRGELIKQFLGESLIYSIFSLLIALILVKIALPLFSSMSGIELKVSAAQIPWLIPGFIGLVIFVGLAAGSYPALFLSAFRPVKVLKGSLKAGAANSRFRSILVVAQFIISISLIIGTAIILKQINYMKKKSLGFDKNNVVVTRLRDQKLRQSIDSIKQQLKQIPGVISVSTSSEVPGQDSSISVFVPEGFSEDQAQLMEAIIVDPDFFPTLDIGIATGRNFSDEFGTDKTEAVIINETAARKFGWDNPIGKIIKIPGDQAPEGQSLPWESRTVIGVVKDFHSSSLHKVIMPQLFSYMPDRLDTTAIRINPKNTSGTLDMIREKWKGIDPLRPLEYFFLDDSFDRQYRADERLSDIFSSFTMFAIFIACLGLFGMASFTAEQRTKEIGIRKVLGATVAGVVVLLSKNFLKLVIIANVIAWPVAYFAMKNWLKNFAYQTNINVWVFLMTGALALAISLLTVSYQSIRAALSNPSDAIKYE